MAEADLERLRAVLDELCLAVAADRGALYLDEGDGTLQLATTAGPDADRGPRMLDRIRRRAERGMLVLRLAGPAGGVLALSRRAGDEFTQQDRAVARLYARRFVGDGITSEGQLSRSGWTRQLEAIQRIAARLTRLASVEEVGATICTETGAVFDQDEAHVLVIDANGVMQRVAANGPALFSDGAVLPLPTDGVGGEAIRRAIDGGVAVLLDDVADLGLGRTGRHSMLIVPLHYESRVSGVICLVACGERRFDDDDMRLLQILSDQAAVAIENARLLDTRDRAVSELQALLEISEASGAAADEATVARRLAARIRSETQTEIATVARWEEGTTVMRVICRDGANGGAELIDVADSAARRQVLRDGRSLVVHAYGGANDADSAGLRRMGAHSLILVPLNAGGRTIGMVEALATLRPRNPSQAAIEACLAMASLAAAGLEKVRVLEQLRRAADSDLVTGVHNHRYLQERLRQEVARSSRSHSPLAVLMLDLDEFKPVNDRHGHADGDRVLRNTAATIVANVRASDIVARYGGDEFVVLMPDASAAAAEQVARRVVQGVLRQRHQLSDATEVQVGISAGLAVYPADGRTPAELLQAADAAMYSAKRTGGRQVERSSAAPSLAALPAAV